MALIDQLDGVVFQAFQQNILSDIAANGVNIDGNTYDNGSLSLVKGGPFSIPGLPSALRPADAFATAHWLRNVGKELFGNVNFKDGIGTALVSTGKSKGFQFVSSQILLASLNPKDPELGGGTIPGGILNAAWNPASLLSSVIPASRPTDFTSVTLGPVFDAKFDRTTSRIDKYVKITKLESQTAQNPEELLGPGKLSRLPTFGNSQFSGFDRVKSIASVGPVLRPRDTPEILHARFLEAADGDTDGVTVHNIPDDQVYMPLVFQDLRDKTAQFLYFRAFIKPDSVTETFTPVWNATKYYGRVDDVPIYMGTSRIISFTFDVVAWQPADLPVVYRKLHKLQSMVYPFFDQQGFLSAGPIIRMRIGDLFSTTNNGKKGLPGYITSLDFAYDNVWNIEKDFKIPRKATVSISFTVLHEGNPGTYESDNNGKKNENSTFGIGIVVPEGFQNAGNYLGDETGIRGLLENIRRTRISTPTTAGSTTPSEGG